MTTRQLASKLIFYVLCIATIFNLGFKHSTEASSKEATQTLTIAEEDVTFTFKNHSASPIFNLSYTLYYPAGEEKKISISKIEAYEEETQNFQLDTTTLSAGDNIIYVKGDYYTSNDPYTIKSPRPFFTFAIIESIKEPQPEFLVENITLEIGSNRGELTATLSNLSSEHLLLSYKCILPKGISLIKEQTKNQINLQARESKIIHIPLRNQWRNRGELSNAILTVNEDNTDYSVIKIVPFAISIKNKTTSYFDILFIFIFFIFLFCIAKYYFHLSSKFTSLITLIFIILFIFEFISPEHIFLDTTTTGGDTIFHYIAAKIMHQQFLPKLKITNWYAGSYGGFPLFTFYGPLPFVLVSLLSFFIKFNVAFKLVTLLGVISLPIASFLLARNLRFPGNGKLFAATLSLLFLFNESYSMYGGNILSTFAGEFAFGISLSILLLFTAALYRGITNNSNAKLNAILLCLVAFSHPLTFIIAVLLQIFFILPGSYNKKESKQNLKYLLKIDLLAFLLLAFWALPFVFRIFHTTALDEFWPLKFKEIFPAPFLPFAAIAIITLPFSFICKKRSILFLFFNVYLSTIMLFISDKIGLVNIRFIPFICIYLLIIAAYGIASLLQILKIKSAFNMLILFSLIGYVFFQITYSTNNITSWSKWNYTGIENKPKGDIYFEMTDFIKNLPGNDRIVYEHNPINNDLGTTRTFESLYDFTGKPTLEGLYIQASATSPFIYYMQSEVSETATNVIVGYEYTAFDKDFAKTINHLKDFNVRYYIAVTDTVKDKLASHQEFKLLKDFCPYAIYELTSNENSYISVLKNPPKFVETKNWKQDSYQWFINNDPGIYVNGPSPNIQSSNSCDGNLEIMEFSDTKIVFKTNNLGCPHLIKISYFPRWKVKGADKIFQASPNFMIVYPNKEIVELYYGQKAIDYLGGLLTIAGIVLLISRNLLNRFIENIYTFIDKNPRIAFLRKKVLKSLSKQILPIKKMLPRIKEKDKHFLPIVGLLCIMISSYIIYFSLISIDRHNRFRSLAYDLGIFDQAIWQMSRFKNLFNSIRGVHIFAEHVTFINILVCPVYWFKDNVRALLIFQSIMLGIGAIPVFLLARHRLKKLPWLCLLIAFSYLFYPALHYLNMEDYHPICLAIPLILFMFYFIAKGKKKLYFLFFFLALLCKEEVSLTTFLIGIYVFKKHNKKIGIITSLLSIIWFVFSIYVIIPYFLQDSYMFRNYIFGGYGGFFGFLRPESLKLIFTKDDLIYLRDILMPIGFISLLSPETLILSAGLILNLISSWPYSNNIQFHHTAIVVPIIFISLIHSFSKIKKNKILVAVMSIFLITFMLISNIKIGKSEANLRNLNQISIDIKMFKNSKEDNIERYEILEAIPKETSVSASNSFITHLTHREEAYLFPNPFKAHYWGNWNISETPPPQHTEYVFITDYDFNDHPEVIEILNAKYTLEQRTETGDYFFVKNEGAQI